MKGFFDIKRGIRRGGFCRMGCPRGMLPIRAVAMVCGGLALMLEQINRHDA